MNLPPEYEDRLTKETEITNALGEIAASHRWGIVPGTKDLQSLISEVAKKESVLARSSEHGIVRVLRVARVLVLFKDLVLVEFFCKKENKLSSRSFRVSLGEKIFSDEKPERAALRGILEELGICVNVPNISPIAICPSREIKESRSFPGLKTVYHFYSFEFRCPFMAFKPEGYVESKNGRKTYFVWIHQKAWENFLSEIPS